MVKKITCISIDEIYYKMARKEALERGIRISQVYNEMLKERYGVDAQ
ncbi:MAG: hypothetical protein KJ939_00825 [Nanoarchaeota archaeon]|nr:hypothetical protein [Nanoarchaeota archaeon]